MCSVVVSLGDRRWTEVEEGGRGRGHYEKEVMQYQRESSGFRVKKPGTPPLLLTGGIIWGHWSLHCVLT